MNSLKFYYKISGGRTFYCRYARINAPPLRTFLSETRCEMANLSYDGIKKSGAVTEL
jgi:hypothetical protein